MSAVAITGIAAREVIFTLQGAIESALESGIVGEDNCQLKHHFAPGLYAREMFIPAGTVIVGKIHRHAHVNNISAGRIRVVTEFGSKIYEAPVQFVSEPGTKRAVYAETDVIWTTYHPTEETELEKIEQHVIAETYEDLQKLTYSQVKGLIA
jgi:hypothetical protein